MIPQFPVSPEKWLGSGHFFLYDSHKIFYRQQGEGQSIVLLHGFPTSSWDWSKIWDQLSAQCRVLAPDFLGFGFSDKPTNYSYSISDQADMIEYLISEVGNVEFHILAHDYGVSVAQELLARFNENKIKGRSYFRIKSVCFLNGGLFQGAYRPLLIQNILAGKFGAIAGKFLNRYSFERSFNKIFGPNTKPSKEELNHFWTIINYNKGKRVIPKIIRYMHERKMNSKRWTNAVCNTALPLRFINGPADPISGKMMADKYTEIVPNADVISLGTIGHYPQTEAPEQVLKYYTDFFTSIA